MKRFLTSAVCALYFLSFHAAGAQAFGSKRYSNRPPVILSPDLADPWVMQLQPGRRGARVSRQRFYRSRVVYRPGPAPAATTRRTVRRRTIDPKFLPATVRYDGPGKPGSIVINTKTRYLYLVGHDGMARRYGIGVGRPGFTWGGKVRVARKAEWPGWTPPAEMRKRQPGLPDYMEGGIDNPLGARAMYLFEGKRDTMYRIHGTNQPWTIGHAVSSGCIRLRNEDVVDLYRRVKVGMPVTVI